MMQAMQDLMRQQNKTAMQGLLSEECPASSSVALTRALDDSIGLDVDPFTSPDKQSSLSKNPFHTASNENGAVHGADVSQQPIKTTLDSETCIDDDEDFDPDDPYDLTPRCTFSHI